MKTTKPSIRCMRDDKPRVLCQCFAAQAAAFFSFLSLVVSLIALALYFFCN